MKIGIPKETYPGEKRVAMVPGAMGPLLKKGIEIFIQEGAGTAAGYPDREYKEKGATLVKERKDIFAQADLVAQVRGFGCNAVHGKADLDHLREGQFLVALLDPLSQPEEAKILAATKVVGFAMEMIPRITRAQSMDALSSMATIAGYKAVIMAADHMPKMFPMMMTAAGTLSPARVFVVGAGVAGLQAIATAKRLGAVVQAYDVRPAVKEQVESLGASFVEMELEADDSETKGGYAKAMDEEFYRKQRELMTEVLKDTDLVITTAAIPGRKAPILVTKEMVDVMPHGSVIIDLAAERGGNCELTKVAEMVEHNGVSIIGPTNMPAKVPYHASQMYAKNVANLAIHLKGEESLELDLEDEITVGTLLCHEGKVVHPMVTKILGESAPEGES